MERDFSPLTLNVIVGIAVRSEVGDSAPLKGTVQLTEPLGDTTLVHFDSTAGNRLVAKVGPSTALQPGSPVSFRFDTGYCHLFEAQNGARLH
jgi:ABC-type sugar transport system ATPase subunit